MNRFQRLVIPAALALTAVVAAPVLFAAPQTGKSATASKAELATGTWSVDKAHTDIAFTVVHLGVSKVRGSFTDFSGTVIADGKKPEASSVSFVIKTASINTGNEGRDKHLQSKDFFEVETYPEITFKSTKVAKTKAGFIATGGFTMHGVTKTISIPFTVSGPQKGPKGELHMGIDAALPLSRKEYGLTWNPVVEGSQVVSDNVNIAISMELTK